MRQINRHPTGSIIVSAVLTACMVGTASRAWALPAARPGDDRDTAVKPREGPVAAFRFGLPLTGISVGKRGDGELGLGGILGFGLSGNVRFLNLIEAEVGTQWWATFPCSTVLTVNPRVGVSGKVAQKSGPELRVPLLLGYSHGVRRTSCDAEFRQSYDAVGVSFGADATFGSFNIRILPTIGFAWMLAPNVFGVDVPNNGPYLSLTLEMGFIVTPR